jgi:Eco47II restriction endonuclease
LTDILESDIQTNTEKVETKELKNAFNLSFLVNQENFFTFSDTRNGKNSIHSWDLIDCSDKEIEICKCILKNRNKKIYVEIKNKDNTMNSSSSQKTYINMQSKILEDSENLCLLVEVIAKQSQNKTWNISLNSKNTRHENIRKVSIDKFYEMVTGDRLAFKKLCETLPSIIDDVLKNFNKKDSINTVLEELKECSKNILENLYMQAFKTYEGFENFKIEDKT